LEITIGRGSRTVSVDLPIKGDAEVSRVHATLSLDNEGRYWIVAKGRNPTLVNGHELPRGEPVEIAPDQRSPSAALFCASSQSSCCPIAPPFHKNSALRSHGIVVSFQVSALNC